MRLDKIGGYQNEEIPLKQERQNSNFSTIQARHIKLLE